MLGGECGERVRQGRGVCICFAGSSFRADGQPLCAPKLITPSLFSLHHRYATGPNLNMYTSLIQDFYSREMAPHQAVHLTIDPDVKSDMGVKAYVSAPVGLSVKPENAVFVPLPVTLLSAPAERPSLALLARAQQDGQGSGPGVLLNDMDALAASLHTVQAQLRRVLHYVRDVLAGKRQGDPVVGRYVIDAVSTVPIGATVDKSGASGVASELENLFNSHLQVRFQKKGEEAVNEALLVRVMFRATDSLILFPRSSFTKHSGRPHGLIPRQCRAGASRNLWPPHPPHVEVHVASALHLLSHSPYTPLYGRLWQATAVADRPHCIYTLLVCKPASQLPFSKSIVPSVAPLSSVYHYSPPAVSFRHHPSCYVTGRYESLPTLLSVPFSGEQVRYSLVRR